MMSRSTDSELMSPEARQALRDARRALQRARRKQYRSHADYLAAKDERRARYFEQGCTDNGEPLGDPTYRAIPDQPVRELVSV